MVRTSIIALALSASGAVAQPVGNDNAFVNEWFSIGTTLSGTEWQLRFKDWGVGKSTTVWLQLDHSKDKTTKARLSLYRVDVDCQYGRIRYIAGTEYGPSGSVLSNWDRPLAESVSVRPGSMNELLHNKVCQQPDTATK